MAGMLMDRAREGGLKRVKAIAQAIAHESPRLADLGEAELERLARVVVAEELKDELKRVSALERIPYATERENFLTRAGRTNSEHTRTAYGSALNRLEEWITRKGLSPLEVSPATADDWIADLRAEGLAASSVRLTVAAASSFWTWLERRHDGIKNPFRGTKARPAEKAKRSLAVPTFEEITAMIEAASGYLKAAIITMNETGLRVGALPSLAINGNRYTCTTKGKEQSGNVPEAVRSAIIREGLYLRAPFGNRTTSQIEDAIRYLTKKLATEGAISVRFSAHDLRHAYAVRLYQATHDIYRVKQALGHASTQVTERYLRSVGQLNE